ncbi:MMPL family transporter [Streptomyces sp. YC504]|uniref:MMPL family transporter n=1 Tax=Streptomyces mesophilus TaxID=1775132 RepID=A0A6G4XM50_9ACTN|nr:MMPL family transporter [Streptomyces mesophilus]
MWGGHLFGGCVVPDAETAGTTGEVPKGIREVPKGTGERRGVAWLVCGRRSKWVVLVLWLVAIVLMSPLAQKLTEAQDNDNSSWLPGDAESTQVLQLSEDFRPEQLPTVILYVREGGLTEADEAKIADNVAAFKELTAHGIRGAETQGPVDSDDKAAAQVFVPITMDEKGWERIAPAVDELREVAGEGSGGLEVYVTGPGGTTADFSEAFEGIDSTLLFAAMGVVIVMLLITYRSPSLLLVPLVSVVGALFTAQAIVYLLAENAGLTVNGQSAGILTVLVFGAGTDYALLLVARYREELHRHDDRHEAMALALHRAGPAVLASGATVMLGMLVLLFADMNSTSGLGPVAAIGVAVALLAMLTLFPALLVIFGRWIFWPVIPHYDTAEPTETGLWARIGRRIAVRPRAIWAATAVLLAAFSLGLMQLRAEGLSNADAFTDTPSSIVGQRVLEEHFAAGSGDPLYIVAFAEQGEAVGRAIAETDGVVAQSVRPAPGAKAEHEGRILLEATMDSPSDSPEAKDTVERVREAVHAVPDADAKVGGNTAALLDMDEATTHDNILIIPLVLLVVFLVLIVLLRALIAPLILIATVVLSFAAALGISALAFRYLFDYAGETTDFPLFVFVFLVALGIDYNIFLTTRIREEALRKGTRAGVLTGLSATGAVITSAGLVLAGTFAALATLPMVAFAEIGFAVALGVLLDTFVVRSVLVTSLFLDVGPKVWWPHRLAREEPPVPAPQEEPALRD